MKTTETATFAGNDDHLVVKYGVVTITIDTDKGGVDSSEDYWTVSHISSIQIDNGSKNKHKIDSILKKVEILFAKNGFDSFTVDNKGNHHYPTYGSLKDNEGVERLAAYLK